MSDLRRLSSLIYHLPVYGPCALAQKLGLYDEVGSREMTFEDMEAMHPDLFGAN